MTKQADFLRSHVTQVTNGRVTRPVARKKAIRPASA